MISYELQEEGFANEIIHIVQGIRKDMGMSHDDKCTLWFSSEESVLDLSVYEFRDTILRRCNIVSIIYADRLSTLPDGMREYNVKGYSLNLNRISFPVKLKIVKKSDSGFVFVKSK